MTGWLPISKSARTHQCCSSARHRAIAEPASRASRSHRSASSPAKARRWPRRPVQRVLAELGLTGDVLLWNVLPTHPGTVSSNRPPTRAEVNRPPVRARTGARAPRDRRREDRRRCAASALSTPSEPRRGRRFQGWAATVGPRRAPCPPFLRMKTYSAKPGSALAPVTVEWGAAMTRCAARSRRAVCSGRVRRRRRRPSRNSSPALVAKRNSPSPAARTATTMMMKIEAGSTRAPYPPTGAANGACARCRVRIGRAATRVAPRPICDAGRVSKRRFAGGSRRAGGESGVLAVRHLGAADLVAVHPRAGAFRGRLRGRVATVIAPFGGIVPLAAARSAPPAGGRLADA